MPIPAGLILYKKELRRLIEKPIDYLDEKDNTLLGSRSGIAPVSCWAVVNRFGETGFLKKIIKAKEKKEAFTREISKIPGLEIVSLKNSLNCAVVKNSSAVDVKEIEKKYGLCFRSVKLLFGKNKKSKKLIAKAFFNEK